MTLLARWRADQLVYEDTGGTDLAENGDGVAAWGIYQGTQAGNLATQATAGNRPTYNSNDDGYPSISVVRASVQRLDLAHSAPWVLTQFSWLSVLKIANNTTANQASHIWGRGSGWTNAGAFVDGFSINTLFSGIAFHTAYNVRAVLNQKPDTTATNFFCVAGVADGTTMRLFVNRQSVTRLSQSQTINFGTNALTIFGDGSSSSVYHPTGAMRELSFWSVALSESSMASEIDTAMATWGVSNTIAPPAIGIRQVNIRGGADQ